MRPTLYEFAGGEKAFAPFAAALHARCLADPELNHPFSHPGQNPLHVERLAAYLAEAMGGPPSERDEFLFGIDRILDGIQAFMDRAGPTG